MQVPASARTEYSIEVEGLRKTFGDYTALSDLSFQVGKGQVLGVLGPNGAGKTTTVKILSTLLKPNGGTARVAGYDVVREAAQVRRSIVMTGQYAALDEQLSGRDNLVLFARLMGLSRSRARQRADDLLSAFGLTEAAGRPVRTYSGGMRRRIDIACGLVVRPEVVFLDEPTTGLDPRSRQSVWSLVTELKSQGITVLLTTQYLEEADQLSDNIIVIDHGRVVAEGTADQLKREAGASFCEIVPLNPGDLRTAINALGDLVPPEHTLEAGADRVAVPAPDGAATLTEALRRLDEANIVLTDIALRRPSLDDVFIALTHRTDTK